MIIGNFIETQKIAATTRRDDVAAAAQRKAHDLKEDVARLDPIREWAALLAATDVFVPEPVRNQALEKLRTHPDLNAAITASMLAGDCVEVLTYLEGTTIPITPALAEPARRGMLCLGEEISTHLRSGGAMWDDGFDVNTRRVLAVADRFKALGINMVATVREFRLAMYEPNPRGFVPHCRVTLDAWIAANP